MDKKPLFSREWEIHLRPPRHPRHELEFDLVRVYRNPNETIVLQVFEYGCGPSRHISLTPSLARDIAEALKVVAAAAEEDPENAI